MARVFHIVARLLRPGPALVVLVCTLGLTGSPVPHSTQFYSLPANQEISRIQSAGAGEFRSGHFAKSLATFERAFGLARDRGDFELALKLQNNVGSAQFALFRYQDAIQSYLKARALAKQRGLVQVAGVIDINLASLYILLGDLDGANRMTGDALQAAAGSDLLGNRHQLLDCLAELRARQGRKLEALQYYRAAIPAADRSGDTNAMGRIWDHSGSLLLLEGDYSAAEDHLLEAFRLRKLSRDRDLRVSYLHLAWLRMEQGDTRSAAILLAKAESMPATDAGEPPCFVTYLHGRLAQKQDQSSSARRYYSEAFRNALLWQEEVGPADSLRSMSLTREEFHKLYEAVEEASLSVVTGRAVEAFEATELYRAAALHQTLLANRHWLTQAPPEYWSVLDRLRAAEIAQLNQPGEASREKISVLRQRLSEIQNQQSTIGTKRPDSNVASGTLQDIQDSLRPGEALFSFYLGDRFSAMWAVTRDRFEKYPLASKREIEALAVRFRAGVLAHQKSPEASELYRSLFPKLDSEFRDQPEWVISASDALFSIPFAALQVEGSVDNPVYLMEKHTIRYAPSATMMSSSSAAPGTREFVGLGDAIYNLADSRYRAAKTRAPGFELSPFMNLEPQTALQLPRLLGSGPEIDGCARTWGGPAPAILLKGAAASVSGLKTALETHPDVLHLAAHVIAPEGGKPEDAAIALALTPAGQPEILTSEDIATLDASGATVIMSGCGSAAGPAIAGRGVLGLTRAWLLAGARVVVGSGWPTPDDTGELFQSFYRHLRNRQNEPNRTRAVAQALHSAQLEMLHSDTWRMDPWYWSAFYALGKD